MMNKLLWVLLISALGTSSSIGVDGPWPEIEKTNRPACIWWWPGSAVDKENLTWNLETMQAAGLGGASIVPIYGVKGYEDRFIPYLSAEWMEMLGFAVGEAERLGMWLDMTTGSGWRFGGPEVTDDTADLRVGYSDGRLNTRYSGGGVKRAAPGGGGKSINPYSEHALEVYLEKFDTAFEQFSDIPLPRAQYHDSFEYVGDWSSDFLARFKELRGYDLGDHLDLLFGEGDSDEAVRIKADYRQTLGELHQEYIDAWVEWSHDHGFLTRNQAHGAPGNLLDLYAATDIPETETFGATPFPIPGLRFEERNIRGGGNSTPLVNRFASSAAHVGGRRLVSAETCTWLRNHFNAALSQVKPEVDQLFVAGINHLFYHGCCYSPKDAPWPGWLFYASTEFNPRNAFWRDFSALNQYVARCQSILQSGWPGNDLLLYWPLADIWHREGRGLKIQLTVHDTDWLKESGCGEVAQWLMDQGYTFDFCSDEQLQALSVADGMLQIPEPIGREQYRAILIPPLKYMPLETVRSLGELAESGATILIASESDPDVPGFNKLDERRGELRDMLDQVAYQENESSGVDHASFGSGRFLRSVNLDHLLSAAQIRREAMVDLGLKFVRRDFEGGRNYFIVNQGADIAQGWVTMAESFSDALWMDPDGGDFGRALTRGKEGALREVYMRIPPGDSLILRLGEINIPEFSDWSYAIPDGPPVSVETGWRVLFTEGEPVLPEPYVPEKLESWTNAPDPEADRFAGTARYTTMFGLPLGNNRQDWVLDLGTVRESARIRLNGEDLGVLWGLPFRILVPGELLKASENVLEVEVTNLSANRIRDLDRRGVPWRIFYDINFVDQNYKAFDASNWPVVDSGLLGPVQMIPVRARPE